MPKKRQPPNHTNRIEELERQLEESTAQLREREKELKCLQEFSLLIEKQDYSLSDIFRELVDIVPRSWQYPELACCRLSVDGVEYLSTGFIEPEYEINADVCVDKKKRGSLMIGYTRPAPTPFEDTFINEERVLLDILAERLGRIIQRKETEQQLKTSEQNFEEIVQHSADAIFITDKNANYTYVNKRAIQLLGYTEEELLAMNIRDLAPPDDLDKHTALFAEMVEKGHAKIEARLIKKDGTDVPVELNAVKLPNGLYYGSCRDVTKRKNAENMLAEKNKSLQNRNEQYARINEKYQRTIEELQGKNDEIVGLLQDKKQSETKFRELFEHIGNGVVIYDVFNDGEDFIISQVNNAVEEIENISQEEIIGKKVTEVFPGVRQLGLFELMQHVHRTSEPHHHTDSMYTDENRKGWRENYVYKIAAGQIVAVYRDITKEKQVQSEREITVELLKFLHSSNGVHDLIKGITELLHDWSGCEAIGVRLKSGDDYPYFETRGFSREFVQAENELCTRDEEGRVIIDSSGNPVLECMCGNVIKGRYDASLPFFTENGSFWTNSTTKLLASTSEEDRQARTRNRCNGEGYESVALIPLKHGDDILGLLQLNDSRTNIHTEENIHLFERLAANLALGLVQKQTAEALKESEKKYRTIIEKAPVGIVYYDTNGIITDCNPEFVKIIGSSREKLIGLDMPRQLKDKKLIEAVKTSLTEGEASYEDWYGSVTANKYTYVVIQFRAIYNKNKSVVAGVGLVEDITERKEAETAIAESEERYRILFDHSNMLISVINREGVCQMVNRKAAAMFGRKQEELIGKSFTDYHTQAGKEYIQRIQHCIDNQVSLDYVDKVTYPAGERWMYSRVHPIDYGKGKPTHAQVISYDITEQKKTEQALVNSEARFKEIFETVKEGIIYVDTKGKVLYVNQALSDITGIPIDEIRNKNAFQLAKKFVSIKQLPSLLKKVTNALQGASLKPFELEFEGKTIEISTRYAKNSSRITSLLRDITHEKHAQQQLIESEKKYRNLFENAPVGVFQTNSRGEVLLVNIEMARMLGFKTTREAKDYYFDLGKQLYADPRKREEFIQSLQKYGEVEDFEFEAKKKNGEKVWLNMNARLVKKLKDRSFIIEGFTSDITQRKLAEMALQEQKILFETMFHSITDAIVITNTKREILLANKGMEKTFGYKPDEVIGKKTEMLYANEHEFNTTGEEIFNNRASFHDEFYITLYKHRNNIVFPGETFGTKLFDAQGQWIGNMGIMRDISERQNFIQQLEEAKEKAEESDRLKSAFLANMSHEIRTPMNGILGFSQMFMRRDLQKEKQQKYAKIIIDNSQQLLNIVNDILDISMIEAGQMKFVKEEVNINQLLEQLFLFHKPQAKKQGININIYKPLDSGQSVIVTDPMRLQQVLNNLISNALKFTSEGSVDFGYEKEGKFLRFFVKDTGIGIAPDLLQEMFERFRQEELEDSRKVGGNGLGLSISKKLVEMMGGQISVNSVKGEGSEFYFTIPYKPQ